MCPLSNVIQTASCLGEAVILNMCGSGVLPDGVSPVVVPQDTLASQKVAVSVIAMADLWNCLSERPAFADLRAPWALKCGISPQVVETWSHHPRIFDPGSVHNSPGFVRAHIRFVGEVCQRFE